MRIRISRRPHFLGGSEAAVLYSRRLQALAGRWVPVETEHLFGDQFNTPPVGDEEYGLRVLVDDVAAIRKDVRPAAGQCAYCRATFHDVPEDRLDEPCPVCGFFEVEPTAVVRRIRPLYGPGRRLLFPARPAIAVWTPEGTVYRDV